MTWPLIKNKFGEYYLRIKKEVKTPKVFWGICRFYLRRIKTAFSLFIFGVLSFVFIINPIFAKKNHCFTKNPDESRNTSTFKKLFLEQKFNSKIIDFNLIQENSLVEVSPPTVFSFQVLGSLLGESKTEETKIPIITEHTVEEGETLGSLAEKFNISLNTILWANDLTEKSIIKPGQKLIIPPISGVIHYVKEGDTLSGIAKTYKGKIEEIIAFNQLANENDIYVGDIIIVPNGTISNPVVRKSEGFAPFLPLASTYFIPPVSSPYLITQGLHWYNAIDFSHQGNACGKPVLAAAGGVIQKIGFNKISGNYVRILHPNGIITFYGHLTNVLVSNGQTVSQGTKIGLMGKTGYATGCHLHFEVRGAKNPFVK